MDFICVLFLLSSPPRPRSMSVVFDFNASLSDVVPVSPMMLSVLLLVMGMSGLLWMPFMCCYFCVYPTDRVE